MTGRDVISINNARLRRAMQLLTFYSEIFPIKYQDEFINELGTIEDNDPYWSKEYVIAADEFLRNHFDEMYMGVFLSKLFGDHECTFTRKDFLKKASGNAFKKAQLNWLFNTRVLR